MKCNSSRSGTNVSCLRSSRRKMLLSFSTTPRAASGSKRISDDTVFSVLNKKCGLIWLESASMRAFSSSCWCRSRFISMRVLFQIFSGAATDISVASTHNPSHQSQCGSMANNHCGLVATANATRPSSKPTQAISGSSSHDIVPCLTKRTTSRGMFKNVNGPKFQKSSLLGIAWRINPPSNPAVDAAGMASHSCAASAGMVIIAPPIGPTTRPPSRPIRNAPSSERSAKRYGKPTKRSATPTTSGGVMNSISFSFWSGSRSSVNSTRRNVFQRASSAANEDDTPTFSSSVNSRSLTEVSVSMAVTLGLFVNASQSRSRSKAPQNRAPRNIASSQCNASLCARFTKCSAPNESRNAGGLHSFALEHSPDMIAAQVLPDQLQPPEHMHLPVRKMFEKTVADQAHHVLPVVITFVGDFFLQHRPDGDYRCECVSEQQELQKKCAAQDAERGGENNGDDAQDLNDRRCTLKQPQVRKRKKSDPAVARTKQHAARRPQYVEQSFLPARALPAQRLQVRRNLRPAHRVRNKMNAILSALLQQMFVQPGHQVEVFANGVRPVSADGAHQVGAKHAECAGNNHQHISLAPRFPADQKRAKVFNHLNDFDVFARQTHAAQVPVCNLRTVQDADNSAHGDDAFRVGKNGQHDAQQRIALQHGVGVYDAHIRGICRIQRRVHRVGLASRRLFVDHQQPRIHPASIESADGRAFQFRDVHGAHRAQMKLLAQLVQRAVRGAVVHHDDFEFRIIQIQKVSHRYAYRALFVVRRGDQRNRGNHRCARNPVQPLAFQFVLVGCAGFQRYQEHREVGEIAGQVIP